MPILGNTTYTGPNCFTTDTSGGIINKVNMCEIYASEEGIVGKVTVLMNHHRNNPRDSNKIVICDVNGDIIENGVSNTFHWTSEAINVPHWVDFTFSTPPTISGGTEYIVYNICPFHASSTYYTIVTASGGRMYNDSGYPEAFTNPNGLNESSVELSDRRASMYLTYNPGWIDYIDPSLWHYYTPLNAAKKVDSQGFPIWVLSNNGSTVGFGISEAKHWGNMGLPSKIRLRLDKTNPADVDAHLDYILIRGLDSAGEPAAYNLVNYAPAPYITIDNSGLTLELDLNWAQGTPPLKFYTLSFQPNDYDNPYELKLSKIQFYRANDPTSFINANPKWVSRCTSLDWTGGTSVSYLTGRTGYFLFEPPAPGTLDLNVNGSWASGFRPTHMMVFWQRDDWSKVDSISAQYWVIDTNSDTIGNSSVISMPNKNGVGSELVLLTFGSYDIAKIQVNLGGDLQDYRAVGIGFWYNE